MKLDAIRLPGCFPDHPDVRSDVADYYFEVQRFDALVGSAMEALEAIGQLDNTLVVMTSDNGLPGPSFFARPFRTFAGTPRLVAPQSNG